MDAQARTPLVEMKDISLAFGGLKAVDDASVDLYPGEVVGLLGHNGAGKSCLIKVLSGAYKRDSGHIFINGAGSHDQQSARRQALRHRDDLSDAGARRQRRRGVEPLSRPRAADALGNARRRLDGGGGAQGDGAAQSQFPPLQGAGDRALRRSASVGRDRPRDPLQRPHPHHGRADRGARSGRDGAGRRADQAAQGRRASASFSSATTFTTSSISPTGWR